MITMMHGDGDHMMSGWGSEHQRLLERRYAAGESDREEFLQRRDDLARRQ